MPDDLFARLEAFYDAVPRDRAEVEEHGPLVLFVPAPPRGNQFYARPRLDAHRGTTVQDVAVVRARQRELGLAEAFEWVHETSPDLLAAARGAGLSVLQAPLLVWDPASVPNLDRPPGVTMRLLDPFAPGFADDLAVAFTVAKLGFAAAGTDIGVAGPADRETALRPLRATTVAREIARIATGDAAHALAESAADGALATGSIQRVGDIAEICGVATLPAARRQGLGAAVTLVLARHAVRLGVGLVFLSAGSATIARVYERIGFRRVGTACIAEPETPRV